MLMCIFVVLNFQAMSDFWFYTVIAIIILHLVVGFVYLMYKMSPTKEDKEKMKQEQEEKESKINR